MFYLHHKRCQAGQRGQQGHAPQPAHVQLLEQKEARPAQLFVCVGGVAHVVECLHFQLLDQTASQVAELVETVQAVIASHTAVT